MVTRVVLVRSSYAEGDATVAQGVSV